MMLLLQVDENATWLAPYAYVVVLIIIAIAIFRAFENWYAGRYNKPLFRHYLVYKNLKPEQVKILEEEFLFYQKLSEKYKRQFRHRVATFISDKKYVGREGLEITDRIKILIASVGCMLSFGRKNYEYGLIEYILVYPGEFYSTVNDEHHKGEFNPREKALVLSWKHFEDGCKNTTDNFNLGIHEFMHAMQLEAKQRSDIDSSRFAKQFQNILRRLTNEDVKHKLDESRYFREYAFTNQYEFMAILAEYFIESPEEFKTQFPTLYKYTQKLLNFRYAGY